MAMEKVYASKGHSARVMSSISQLWHNKKYCDAVLQIGSKRLEVCLMGRIIFLMVNLLKLTKDLPKLYKSFHFKMPRSSCTDKIRVNVPSFQKITLFTTILNIPQKHYPFAYLIV